MEQSDPHRAGEVDLRTFQRAGRGQQGAQRVQDIARALDVSVEFVILDLDAEAQMLALKVDEMRQKCSILRLGTIKRRSQT